APKAIAQLFVPLKIWLEDDALLRDADEDAAKEEVSFATVFTTHPSVTNLRRLAVEARKQPVPEIMELERIEGRDEVVLLRPLIQRRGFQQGTIPYKMGGDGGAIAPDASGRPIITHLERTRISLVIPRQKSGRAMPSGGWPIVLYSHGTGGDYSNAY